MIKKEWHVKLGVDGGGCGAVYPDTEIEYVIKKVKVPSREKEILNYFKDNGYKVQLACSKSVWALRITKADNEYEEYNQDLGLLLKKAFDDLGE